MNAMPELTQLALHESQIAGFLKGHKDATRFICDMFSVLHIWDDLIDQDKELTNAEISQTFWLALVHLPSNPFYCQHFNSLQPVLVNSILNWQAANGMEDTGGDKNLSIAFILRGAYIDLVTISAYLACGRAWAEEITPAIRQWAHEETYPEYLSNLAAEKEARNVQ